MRAFGRSQERLRGRIVEATHGTPGPDRESTAIEAGAQDVEPLEHAPEDVTVALFFTARTVLDSVTTASKCAGWTVTLVNENFTPAPNPLPPGWSGFICVSAGANVPFGSVFCFTVSFVCNVLPAVINICATACECPVPTTPTPWGHIKARYAH